MSDDEKTDLEKLAARVEAGLIKARNVALMAVATVAAIGALTVAIVDQYHEVVDHLQRKTVQIDRHLEKTDQVVVDNTKRLDAVPDAPPAAAP